MKQTISEHDLLVAARRALLTSSMHSNPFIALNEACESIGLDPSRKEDRAVLLDAVRALGRDVWMEAIKVAYSPLFDDVDLDDVDL